MSANYLCRLVGTEDPTYKDWMHQTYGKKVHLDRSHPASQVVSPTSQSVLHTHPPALLLLLALQPGMSHPPRDASASA